jgi:hypothetical protein
MQPPIVGSSYSGEHRQVKVRRLSLLLFVVVGVVFFSRYSLSDVGDSNKVAATSFVMLLQDGRQVEVSSFVFVAGFIVVSQPDGTQVGFPMADVIAESIPVDPKFDKSKRQTPPARPTPWILEFGDGMARPSDFENPGGENKGLTFIARGIEITRSSDDPIVIVGQEKTRDQLDAEVAEQLKKSNPCKYNAMMRFIEVASGQAARGLEVGGEMRRYMAGCTGTVSSTQVTRTYSETTTSGQSVNQISGDGVVVDNRGRRSWFQVWGTSVDTWSETTSHGSVSETVTESRRGDADACVAIDAAIQADLAKLGAVIGPEIDRAHFDGVGDYKLDEILEANTLMPVEFWQYLGYAK